MKDRTINIANICVAVEILAGCVTIGTVCIARKTVKPLWGLALLPFGRILYYTGKEKENENKNEPKESK